ncbi:MAG: hypothetical protein ABI761_09830 [Saprospiraceae bacterium]
MNSWIKAVLFATLIAGLMDITSAYIDVYIRTGHISTKMFQYIAGGALGLDTSLKGGLGVQALGLCIHFFLAFSYTLTFFLIYPKLHLQQFNKYLIGFIYGFLVGMFMTFVVLPLTKLPHNPFDFAKALKAWLILAFMLGIPVSFIANRYYSSLSH